MARSPKKSSDKQGFEEAPQAPFEGESYEGSMTDWLAGLEKAVLLFF